MSLIDAKHNKQVGLFPLLIIESIAFLLALGIEFYITVLYFPDLFPNLGSAAGLKMMLHEIDFVHFVKVLLVTLAAMVSVLYFGQSTGKFVYRYRYLIAFAVLVIAVTLELSGSSIDLWKNYLTYDTSTVYKPIFGVTRPIRTDEWAVSTPTVMSQFYATGFFPYQSDVLRGTVTDAFISATVPICDITMLFRPFLLGYILLGPAKGLAFFWAGRAIALFMVTFEFAMLITKKNKWLSVAMAILLLFAPVVQWWFIAGGLVEMLIYGQLAILIIYHYMYTQKYWQRVLYAVSLALVGLGFAFTLYPSWEIPMAYVFLAILIWVILSNFKTCTFHVKDIGIVMITFVLLGSGVLYIFTKSSVAVHQMMSTVYPGARLETGGGQFLRLFQYAGNLFFPIKDKNLLSNVCEQSVFFDFFPLGIVLALLVIFKQRKKDVLLFCLLGVTAVLGAWCVFTWPAWLAKITLLSNCQSSRAHVAFGFANILLLIRSMAVWEGKLFSWNNRRYGLSSKNVNFIVIAAAAGIVSLAMAYLSKLVYGDYLIKFMAAVIAFLIFIAFILIIKSNYKICQKLFVVFCVVAIAVPGMCVNPVQKGIGVIYDSKVAKGISAVNAEDKGIWIVENTSLPLINFPVMVGAATINSTNFYPDVARWNALDTQGEFEELYNRYAHINISLQNTKATTFTPSSAGDCFNVLLNTSDLKKLDVKYIFTQTDLAELNDNQIQFEEKYEDSRYKIYKVINR